MAINTGIYVGYAQFYNELVQHAHENNLIDSKVNINYGEIELPTHSFLEELDLLIAVDDAQWKHSNAAKIADRVDELVVKNIEAVPREVLRSSTRVHLVDESITTHGGLSDATIHKIEEIHEQQQLNKDILREHRGGRPPIGCSVEDGYLVKNDEYSTVQRVLKQYRNDLVSAEGAANALNTSTKTISNAASRDELYQLQ